MRRPRRRVRPDGPLRVMFVVPHLMVGGAERHASTLLVNMDPARFRGSIVCLQDRGHMGANWERLEAADVPRTELHKARRDYLGMLTGLVREMRREKPDIVYVRGFNAEILGRVAAILTGVPRLLIWVRNCGDVTPPGPRRRWLNRRLARATDAVYGVAYGQLPYVTDDLGYDADQLRVIYNGIDPDWIGADRGEADVATAREIGVAEGETVIGTLAVMRPEKDHPTLLRAFRKVVDERTDVKLALVGDGPQRGNIEALIDELGLRPYVLLLGHQNDVRRLLRTFDVFTLSSRTVEACPNSLLEAMSAGIPAVCTAVGGVPEMIDDGVTGHVVPREDPDAMAKAFLALLADPEAAREMGRAGRRRVQEHFTHERSMAAAQDALEETAGRRAPAASGAPDPVRVTLVLDIAAHGGAETVLRHTFDRLDPARVVTDVVSLREPGPLAGYFRTAGIPFTWLERRGRFDLSTLPKLVGHLRRRGTDVVLSPNYHKAALMMGRTAALLSRRPGGRGASSVVAAHNMDRTVVNSRVLPTYAVNTMFMAGGLQLISPRQIPYLRAEEGYGRSWFTRTREFVVRNGIPLPPRPTAEERAEVRAELGVGDEHVVVGIVARLMPAKAHHVLFDAVAGLDDPRLRVVVVGDGQRRAELEEIVARRGLGGQITFLGQRRDAERLLAGFDVFALSSDHEGVPLSIMEAMAKGLPVVSTDVGAVADLITDGEEGYLVPRGDAPALGARLRKLADDPDLRAALSERALARAEREFAIENTAAEFTAMVEAMAPRRVAGKRRPRP